jgi:hypothetical protein
MDERKLTCEDVERGGGRWGTRRAPRASTLANEGGFRRTTSAVAGESCGGDGSCDGDENVVRAAGCEP